MTDSILNFLKLPYLKIFKASNEKTKLQLYFFSHYTSIYNMFVELKYIYQEKLNFQSQENSNFQRSATVRA